MLSYFVFLTTLIALASAHSWIACTDYAEKNAAYWDPNKCRGFARQGYIYTKKDSFGLDTGYDYHASNNQPCKISRSDEANYNSEYPMATYFPGQQVVLAHPMKNHGADTGCTNPYIPDNGNHLYMAPRGSRSDVTLEQFRKNLVADLGASPNGHGVDVNTYPKPGFQNAPAFCENTDKALGTYSFNVPSNMAPGVYTFLWTWGFNSRNDLYSSCFEVEIMSKNARDRKLQDKTVACGGVTSDGRTRGSSLGCIGGGINPPVTVRPTIPTTTTRRPFTTRRPLTTRRPTFTRPTTRAPTSGGILPVNMRQLSGTIDLPESSKSIEKRVVSIHFDCPVRANFWPISSVSKHNHDGRRRKRHAEAIHHDITLMGRRKAQQKKIFFHATFAEDCNIVLYPPIAKLVSEE